MRNLLLIIITCLSLSACASHYGAAHVISNPPGAEIIDAQDGSSLGVTPTTIWRKDSSGHRQQVVLRYEKEGYRDKVSPFWLSMRHKSKEAAEQDPTTVEVNLEQKANN